MTSLISIQEAAALIASSLPIMGSESIPLNQASGRVLREPILADRNIPPYERVMMDGVAIDTEEFYGIGTVFNKEGIQAAGSAPKIKKLDQSYFEVMTGAPLPSGCNCVIPYEEISQNQSSCILSPDAIVKPFQFIHREGSDAKTKTVLLKVGTKLGANELAIAASVGTSELNVSILPRVIVLTSGDEVVPPSSVPLVHQIRSSHPTAIKSTIESSTLGLVSHIHIPDNLETTINTIKNSLSEADVIILTGGISMGKYDFIATALRELVGAPLFHRVRQKPGKPFGYWCYTSTEKKQLPIFALPGNPVSVMATLARYVIPSLKSMLTLPPLEHSRILAESFTNNARLPSFTPSVTNPNGTYKAVKINTSGDYLCLSRAEGFFLMEPNTTYPEKNTLDFFPLG